MGWVEVAEATKWVGELTVEPFAGELIVTPAKALEIKQQTMAVHQTLLLCIRTLHRSGGVQAYPEWLPPHSSKSPERSKGSSPMNLERLKRKTFRGNAGGLELDELA